MDLGIAGRVALVTASSSGLGAAIAEALAREGVKVAITGTKAEKLEAQAARIRASGALCLPLVWNLEDLSAAEPAIARIEAELGPVSILVNNTGGPPPGPISGQSEAQWSRFFQAMVMSVIQTTDRVLPGMRAQGFGRIITCTSSGVVAPIPNLGISNTMRTALVAWSKSLAREVAKQGITANVLVPGRIATDRVAALDAAAATREGKTVADIAAASQATIPVGRYGRPEEFADAAAFLASARASFITGSVLRVDGGMIASL